MNPLHKLSLGVKLLIGFGLMIASLGAVVAPTYAAPVQTQRSDEQLLEQHFGNIYDLASLRAGLTSRKWAVGAGTSRPTPVTWSVVLLGVSAVVMLTNAVSSRDNHMKRVLVVEDNPANFYLIDFILSRNGYAVLKASTGEEGVALAATERPDLVLMDIQLPGIDGLETTRRIRRGEKGCPVPIVALTSFALAGDRERALAAGCTGHIEKPIDPATFVHDIEVHVADTADVKKE